MLGLIPLFVLAAAVLTLLGTAAMVRAATRPDSRGYAWCLARGLPTEPAEIDAEGNHITLELTRGDTTQAFDLVGQDPQGPCVVAVHGHSASRYLMLNSAPPLLEHASRVVLFDLPGHGDCSAKRCTMGVREPGDIVHVLEQLDDGRTPLVLFGSSMGAQCAIAAAANLAERHEGKENHGDDQSATSPRLAGLILLGVYRFYAEAIPGHLRRQRLPRYPFFPLGQLWLHLIHGRASRFDRAEDAKRLRCPVLLLHGEHDDLCPLASAEAIRDAVQNAGGDAELVVFEGGGHTVLAQTHPALFEASVSRFLSRFQTSTATPAPTMSSPAAPANSA